MTNFSSFGVTFVNRLSKNTAYQHVAAIKNQTSRKHTCMSIRLQHRHMIAQTAARLSTLVHFISNVSISNCTNTGLVLVNSIAGVLVKETMSKLAIVLCHNYII